MEIAWAKKNKILVTTPVVARSQNSVVSMNTPAARFDALVAWQKAHKFLAQFFRGLFVGHSGFWLLNSVYLSNY
jgi:hypothetical protein